MTKKIIKYLVFLLIIFLLPFWLLDFNTTKKQFEFLKIKKILSKDAIVFLSNIKKQSTKFINYKFIITKKKEYILENNKVKFEKFSNKILRYRYYLTQNKDNIFLTTNRGEMFFFPKTDIIDKKKISLEKIKTNLETIIGKKYIQDAHVVVKGILIINQKIYVSYINNNNECFSNAIVEGNLSIKKINFYEFFKLDECKDLFTISTGGNMQQFKNNKILLTVGDNMSYETAFKDDPQNKNSYYGKILSIDLTTKNIDILSMGHRNQQGLYYDSKEDIIFSTEHGPQGGDEINAHINPNKNIIKNYGWAISSYGEHYGFEDGYSERVKDDINLEKNKLYKVAPLNKSHKIYGFEEPIKYFTPAIGITQILRVNNSINSDYKLLVGSMGLDKEEDDMTIHILNFNKDFEETKYEKIYIGERIRDMIDLNNGSILMTLESTGSLGLLKDIY